MRPSLSVVLAGAIFIAGHPSDLLSQQSRYTLSGQEIAIYNLAGQFRVEAGTGNDVVVEVTRVGDDAAQLRVETGEIRGANTLRVIYPGRRVVYADSRGTTNLSVREDGTFGGERGGGRHSSVRISSSGDGVEAHANIRVLVPSGRRLSLYLGAGKVDVTNVTTQLLVDVASASVSARGVRGALMVDAGSGDVEIADATGDLMLDTGSGEVRVSGAKGGRHNIDTGSGSVNVTNMEGDRIVIDVGSGDVNVRGLKASDVRLDSGSGSIDAELTGTVRDLIVDTGSGDVTLRLPKDFGAEVEIDTGSGSIRSSFPVTTQELKSDALRGRIGNGGTRLRIDTGSGSVQLLQL